MNFEVNFDFVSLGKNEDTYIIYGYYPHQKQRVHSVVITSNHILLVFSNTSIVIVYTGFALHLWYPFLSKVSFVEQCMYKLSDTNSNVYAIYSLDKLSASQQRSNCFKINVNGLYHFSLR